MSIELVGVLGCDAESGLGRDDPHERPGLAARHGAVEPPRMSRHEQLLQRILGGRSDASVRFDDLRGLLRNLGFTERVRGSHHIFRREGVAERINLQRDDSHAKPYQVQQVRRVIVKYRLEEGKLNDV